MVRPQKQPIRAPKSEKKVPKIKSKSNVRIEETIENKSWLATWVDPKTIFEPNPEPKKSPLGPKNIKYDPNIKSYSNIRIELNIENKSCCTKWVEPKTIFEPALNRQNSQGQN